MTRLSLLISVAAVATATQSVDAQKTAARQKAAKPAEVVRSFFDAVAHERWVEAAGFLEVDVLDHGRRQQLEFWRHPPPEHRVTLEELMKQDPEMPRAVAEYQLARMERLRDRFDDQFSYEYANVHDTTTLAQMSPLETGARWLEARDERYQLRRAREQDSRCQQVPLDAFTDSTNLLPRRVVLGALESGDTAFVLYRNRVVAGPQGNIYVDVGFGPSVATLRRRNAIWRLLPNESLLRGGMGGSGALSIVCGVVMDSTQVDSSRARKKPPE
jgi:hypothetical protein